MTERLVIVGNGMVPGRMLEHLLDEAPGRYAVTIFTAEPRVNYDRIMLSPVLSGEKTFADIVIHDDAWYARHGITLHKGSRVARIDREARTVLVVLAEVRDAARRRFDAADLDDLVSHRGRRGRECGGSQCDGDQGFAAHADSASFHLPSPN